jgi:hypothetical protein
MSVVARVSAQRVDVWRIVGGDGPQTQVAAFDGGGSGHDRVGCGGVCGVCGVSGLSSATPVGGSGVLGRQLRRRAQVGPGDGKRGVVPADAALVFGAVVVGGFCRESRHARSR